MVKSYKRTKDWSKEVMRNMVDSVVQGKMGYYLAAKAFSVPQTTLERKLNILRKSFKKNVLATMKMERSVKPQIKSFFL